MLTSTCVTGVCSVAGPHIHVAVVVAGVHTHAHAHAHVTHVHDGWCPFVKVEGSSLNRVVTNCYDRSEKIEEALDDFWSQANVHPSALPTTTYIPSRGLCRIQMRKQI